jgi:hypothetical protein
MENTQTEFADYNFIRVLQCLNKGYGHLERGPRLNALANRQIWFRRVVGVKPEISLGVKYLTPAPEGNYVPPTMIISAKRGGAP